MLRKSLPSLIASLIAAVLSLRAWAIWNKQRYLTIALPIILTLMLLITLTVWALFMVKITGE
jgi:hypothetical protein